MKSEEGIKGELEWLEIDEIHADKMVKTDMHRQGWINALKWVLSDD